MINGNLKSFIGAWHTLNIKPSCCRLLDLAFKDWDWSFDDVDDIDGDDDDDVFDFWRSIRGKLNREEWICLPLNTACYVGFCFSKQRKYKISF